MKVVIVSPNAADSGLAVGFLAARGMETLACGTLADLGSLVGTDIGCVVLVEEALVDSEIDAFHEALDLQPAWSDLPLILIAAGEHSLSTLVDGLFPRSGNVTLLQRPLHPVTLVSAVNVALRSRQRQFQVRDLLAQREEAVRQRDEFLAMLAHELRNPLAPIRNAVYLLGTIDNADPLFVKCRGMIEKQSRHISRLVDDLLDVSRLERGKVGLRLQQVDMNESLTSAVEACAPMTALHRHDVVVRPSKQPLLVRADPVRLEQVVGNLIVNAAKFTPDGGSIVVEAAADGGQALVAVADNGIGIEPGMLHSIFDLFTQGMVSSARTDGGLGIGLTLVKRLVELHGGSVRAVSAGLGCGSRFEVRLPLDARATRRDYAQPGGDAASPPSRILVIEDGADARDSLAMLIRAWNHEVACAANGPDGLHRAREDRPDVVLIDIGLPGFDGYQVASQIRSEDTPWSRAVRLIAVTGYGQAADKSRAIGAGFDVHILKPVDPAVLRELLATHALSG